MIVLREKRGVNSHVEMILSVVLFLAFVGVALYFFRPANTSRLVDSSLDYASREIEKNTSTEIYSYSVLIDEGVNSGAETFIMYLRDMDPNSEVAVYDSNGNVIPSKKALISGSFIIYSEFESKRNFIYVIVGKEITPYEGYIPNLKNYIGPPSYTLASTSKIDVTSEKKIKMLIESYKSDYNLLKKEFNIPNRVDFGFELSLSDGSVIDTGGKNITGTDVFVKTEKIEILRENNQIERGELRIKVW